MKRNLFILIIVAAAIAAVFVYTNDKGPKASNAGGTAEQGQENDAAKPKPGSKAPAFKLAALDDKLNATYEAGGPRDKVLIVNFWASWCGPCELEAPDLKTLNEKYKDKVDLYAVNATKYDVVRNAKLFVKEHEFTFPVLTDADGKVGDEYKVFSYPISFVIGRDGTIIERIEGVKPLEDWEALLDKAIAG
ncbi:TlpA family protein disulfide reductase [Cohnella faecalis]|nr:TlpA disulfide reductase family protein [Cohnella faecalis]